MAQALEGIASDVERLTERVRHLEQRLALFEGQLQLPAPTAPQTVMAPDDQQPRTFPPFELPSGAVPAFGKAVLGFAGAYLLRAIAESGAIPQLPILFVAILYSGIWMVLAARTHSTSRFAGIAYGATSALILGPLLWESTARFNLVSATFTAVVLSVFFTMTLALSWKRNLQAIPWVALLSTEATAVALIIATHELVPLTAALLVMALVTEVAACFGHRLTFRVVPAITVNLAIWLLIDLMTSSSGVPGGYPTANDATLITMSLGLFVIYAASIAVRGFGLREPIAFLEIVQVVPAFVLALFGTLRSSHGLASPVLGIFVLLLAGICYWGTLLRFTREADLRNRRASAHWAAALLVIATILALSVELRVPFLCLAAVGAAFLYARTKKLSLGIHTSFYLVAATLISSLPIYAENALLGTVPTVTNWSIWTVAVSSAICCFIGSRIVQETKTSRLLWIVPAFLVSISVAALAVVAIASVSTNRMDLNPSRLSVVRTVVTCVLAFAVGFAGSRCKRIEFVWVAYAVVALGTFKLLFEDLRFGNPDAICFLPMKHSRSYRTFPGSPSKTSAGRLEISDQQVIFPRLNKL